MDDIFIIFDNTISIDLEKTSAVSSLRQNAEFMDCIVFHNKATNDERFLEICAKNILYHQRDWLANILEDSVNLVEIMTLKFGMKHVGDYTIALGCQTYIPDNVVTTQLEKLYDLIVFYYGSIRRIKHSSFHTDHPVWENFQSFFRQMEYILRDCYFYINTMYHFVDLKACLQTLPMMKCNDDSMHMYNKGISILKCCQKRPGVIAGCIFYKEQILCTQFNPDLTWRLLMVKPNQRHPPNKCLSVDFDLKTRLRLFEVYLKQDEYRALLQSRGDIDQSQASSFDTETPGGTNQNSETLTNQSAETLTNQDSATLTNQDLVVTADIHPPLPEGSSFVDNPDRGVTNDDPGVTNDDPGVTNDDLGVTNDDPEVTNDDLGVTNDDPGVTNDDPGVTDEDPGVTNDDLGLTNVDLGVTNDDPGVTDEDPGVTNDDLGVTNDHLGVTNDDLGVTNELPNEMNREMFYSPRSSIDNTSQRSLFGSFNSARSMTPESTTSSREQLNPSPDPSSSCSSHDPDKTHNDPGNLTPDEPALSNSPDPYEIRSRMDSASLESSPDSEYFVDASSYPVFQFTDPEPIFNSLVPVHLYVLGDPQLILLLEPSLTKNKTILDDIWKDVFDGLGSLVEDYLVHQNNFPEPQNKTGPKTELLYNTIHRTVDANKPIEHINMDISNCTRIMNIHDAYRANPNRTNIIIANSTSRVVSHREGAEEIYIITKPQQSTTGTMIDI